MVNRDELVSYLNDYLSINDIRDYGPQGIQVEGKERVKKIVTGVSASLQLFEEAAKVGADMVIVHHGIIWDKESLIIKGGHKERLKALLENDMSLVTYHLPLDVHPTVGNNAIAAQRLGLTDIKALGDIGVQGTIKQCSPDELLEKIQNLFKSETIHFMYGPKKINRIGLCSGAAHRDLPLAIDAWLDAYITGEASESIMHQAKEGNIHFIAAGHYSTERLGVQALGEHIAEKFKVDVEFIEIPNPV